MCQVIPFTLPCCSRVYVSISKLPSCPDSWPKAKCPPELCIQMHGIAPEERSTGVCWRCKADAAGKSEFEKQKLRPAIDKARVVISMFYDLGYGGRRHVVEEGGHCWFCNAKGGCSECGAKEIIPEEQASYQHREETPGKRKHREGRPEKDRAMRKRIKTERSEGTPSTPGSVYSLPRAPTSHLGYSHSLASPATTRLAYPDPSTPTNWHPDSPYLSSHYLYGANSTHETFALQTHTPPNQQAMFHSPTSTPRQSGSSNQHWTAFSDHHLLVPQISDDIPYMGTLREVVRQPREEMHRITDPSLLQPKADPDVNSTSISASVSQWNSKSVEIQNHYEELDLAIFDSINEEYQSAYENEMQQLEDDDLAWPGQ